MCHRSCRNAFNRMKLDHMMKKKNASRNPPAANGHAQLCFCWHGEEEDMKMQVRVADAEENGL